MKLKKVLVAILTIALVFAAPKAAFASAEATSSVVGDGDAYSYTDDTDNLLVDNEQSAYVANLDAGVGISGGNSQSYSDDENSMTTGDADGSGGSDNFLNSNVSLIEDPDAGSSTAESTVGEDGDAVAKAYDNDEVTVENYNMAGLENLTLGVAVSGGNSQDDNDDGNSIETGNSDAMAHALNELNSNWTTIGGSHSAHATASVGNDGDAYAYSEDNDSLLVSNNNSASLSNASLAFAISGGNSQSGNDDDNSIATGGSTANSSAANFVNSNVTVLGSYEGDSASATAAASVGEDGNANGQAYDNDEVTVENTNQAEVQNVSVAAGVSGGNTQSDNDDTNTMTTGAAHGSSCSTNTVNSNWTVVGGTLPVGEGAGGCGLAE